MLTACWSRRRWKGGGGGGCSAVHRRCTVMIATSVSWTIRISDQSCWCRDGGPAIAAMNGSHEKVDDSVSSKTLKKAAEDEVIEDEFNIHSTVGLVSALLLSCLASTVSDSKDLKDFAEERDRRWELQDEGVSIFDVYQALIFVSMSCNSVLTTVNFATASVTSDHASLCMFVKHRIRGNVLAIMTAIARLIAFQRVAKSDAPEFQRIMGEGRVG